MSDNPLLILITRITGSDEWNDVWNFPRDKFVAFIHSGQSTYYSYREFQELDLAAQLDADVWVLRGYDYTGPMKPKKIHQALNQIKWEEGKVMLMIHRGGGTLVSAPDFKEHVANIEFENTRALFKQAVDYSIGTENLHRNPIVRFAWGLNENLTDAEYKARFHSVIAPMPLHVKIADAMHRLSYVLQPLDIDFQGLKDTDFQLEYWKELAEDYKGGKALGKLEQTRALLYSKSSGADDSVETVLQEAKDLYETGSWNPSWNELEQNLVPRKGFPKEFDKILPLVQDGSETNLETIKDYFSGSSNPIHEWVTNVHKTLGELRDAISEREIGPGKQ